MRLSRKDEHSITALLVLANQERNQLPMNLTELAAALEISTSYLEHLFGDLFNRRLTRRGRRLSLIAPTNAN